MGSNIETKAWTIADLVGKIDSQAITLPRFQRAQVWTKAKQKQLVKSIANDFPIGCFLVYEDKRAGTCQLIDGLQRATAIYLYHKEPLSYIDFRDLTGRDGIAEAVDRINKACEEQLGQSQLQEKTLNAISEWLPETDIYSSSKYDAQSLADSIVKYYEEQGLFQGDDIARMMCALTISKEIKESGFLDKLKTEVSLDTYTFPVIFYTGDKKNLPDIFDRINVEGMKLSKYDILAAAWYGDGTRVTIHNKKLKHAIEQKYATAQESGFEIEGLDHSDEDYTLFEYLFGLGKMIADDNKYKILFKGGRDQSAVESFAFTIACIAYHLRLSDLSELPKVMKEKAGVAGNASLDPEKFTNALIDSVNFINEVLKGYIGIELQKPFIAHTEYQICSYITRALVGKYDIETWRVRDEWNEDKKKLEAFIPQHYLYELLSNFWGNAGDSKLFNNVWDGTSASLEYKSGYTRDQWNAVINTWYSANLKKKQTARSSIEANDKVLLKYVYGQIATAAEEKDLFDIDHLYPVKLLADRIGAQGENAEGWPISAVGNLAFISKSINTKKGTRTLKDYYESIDASTDEGANTRKTIQRFSLVDDPTLYGADENWGHDEYIAFVKMRNERIRELLLERFML